MSLSYFLWLVWLPYFHIQHPSFIFRQILAQLGACEGWYWNHSLTMDEEYDVIVLGTGLKVCEAFLRHFSWFSNMSDWFNCKHGSPSHPPPQLFLPFQRIWGSFLELRQFCLPQLCIQYKTQQLLYNILPFIL